jgi:hypothetical protein
VTGNPQQDRRRHETRGNRRDPVHETRDNLRTPCLKRGITLARHFGGRHHRDWPLEQSDALQSEVLALVQYQVTDPICDIGGSVGNLRPEANPTLQNDGLAR